MEKGGAAGQKDNRRRRARAAHVSRDAPQECSRSGRYLISYLPNGFQNRLCCDCEIAECRGLFTARDVHDGQKGVNRREILIDDPDFT
jgi:hypothetical protein